MGCRYAELGGHIELSPTDPSDPLFPQQPDAISMDVRSAAFGSRLTDFKIQFLPPCFVLYYIPAPMVRACTRLPMAGHDRHACALCRTPFAGACLPSPLVVPPLCTWALTGLEKEFTPPAPCLLWTPT